MSNDERGEAGLQLKITRIHDHMHDRDQKSGYETKIFIFSYEGASKPRMNTVDHFLISYLVPEISTFKEPKHDTQNWFTANNNNGQNYDVIGFAC